MTRLDTLRDKYDRYIRSGNQQEGQALFLFSKLCPVGRCKYKEEKSYICL